MDLTQQLQTTTTTMSTTNLSGLQPIEFILPNAILSLTEWSTRPEGADGAASELTFSMEHLYLLINYALGRLFKPGFPSAVISRDVFHKPVEVLDENKLEIIDHYWYIIIAALSLFLLAFFIPILCFLCCCFCCRSNSGNSGVGRKPPKPRSARHYVQHQSQSQSHQYPSSSGGHRNSSSRGGGASHHIHSTSSSSSSSRHTSSRSSSASRHKVESPCDCCFRPILSLLLLSLLVLTFLFIVCAFVTNDSLAGGVKALPQAANSSLADFELYLNNTQYELDILFKTNFAQLESQLRANLNRSGDIVRNRLAVISEAIAINNLTQIVANLQPILHDLKRLINDTGELKFLTAQLKGKIARSKADLAEFFALCRHPVCLELSTKYRALVETFSVSSRIDSLPRLLPVTEKLEYLLGRDIVREVSKGKERLDRLAGAIQRVVDEVLPGIGRHVSHASQVLNDNVEAINGILAQPVPTVRRLQRAMGRSGAFIAQHEHYVQYLGLTATLLLFTILLCYLVGLLCGVCSDQPTRYNFRLRSKKSELFFTLGLALFFLSFTLLLVLATLSVVAGGVSDRSACYYLENVSEPQSERVIRLLQSELLGGGGEDNGKSGGGLIEKFMGGEGGNSGGGDTAAAADELKPALAYLRHVQLAQLLARCHANGSLFDVLQLDFEQKIRVPVTRRQLTGSGKSLTNSIDDGSTTDTLEGEEGQAVAYIKLSDVVLFKEKKTIEDYLSGLLGRLDQLGPVGSDGGGSNGLVLLTAQGEELLRALQETPLETLNFSSFAHVIRHSITPVDLELISRRLEEESLKLPEAEIDNVARLRNIAMDLKSSRDLINSITNKIENLTRNAEKIERKSHYNGRGMRETLALLLKQAADAQRFINVRGRAEIKAVLRSFIADIGALISQYIAHVEYRIKHEIGRCEPVSRAFNHTVEALCDDIVLPFTACWFSIAVSLLLFVPATVLVCALNSLFRRIKRSSVRRESILIIDNYDEDNIPLAEIDKESSHRRIVPSAPVGNFSDQGGGGMGGGSGTGGGGHFSEEETWSPSALPQHHYSRPPPYHF